jgi:hypothetical protein
MQFPVYLFTDNLHLWIGGFRKACVRKWRIWMVSKVVMDVEEYICMTLDVGRTRLDLVTISAARSLHFEWAF